MTFIKMTPEETKNGGENLSINYGFRQCQFGELIVASTTKGLCHISFIEKTSDGLVTLKKHFPKARLFEKIDRQHQDALAVFDNIPRKIKLHLNGTPFQVKVWQSLAKISFGSLTTYGKVAADIGQDKAARAVGSAIGRNPIAFIVPCHRVIQSSGNRGAYMWGAARKSTIIDWEMSLNL